MSRFDPVTPLWTMSMESEHPRKKPRRWNDKFREAFRGLKLGIRGHSSFYVHFFFAAMVIAVGLALECDWLEWCILLGCIGFVFTTELINSAIETLFHGLDVEAKNRIKGCLDIAAGAVLAAAMTAVCIGSIVIVRRGWKFFHG